MTREERHQAILKEQAAFDLALPELLKSHRGQVALMKDGAVVGYFPDVTSAYADGVTKYGPEAAFLVARVEEQVPKSLSLAWEHGVMFGS